MATRMRKSSLASDENVAGRCFILFKDVPPGADWTAGKPGDLPVGPCFRKFIDPGFTREFISLIKNRNQKCCHQMRLLCSKICQNAFAFAAGAPPRTSLEELTALPRPPRWILERGRRKGKETETKGRGGSPETVFPVALLPKSASVCHKCDFISQNERHGELSCLPFTPFLLYAAARCRHVQLWVQQSVRQCMSHVSNSITAVQTHRRRKNGERCRKIISAPNCTCGRVKPQHRCSHPTRPVERAPPQL